MFLRKIASAAETLDIQDGAVSRNFEAPKFLFIFCFVFFSRRRRNVGGAGRHVGGAVDRQV